MRTVLLVGLVAVLAGCSTMHIEQYPSALSDVPGRAAAKNGVSIVARPLDREDAKKYFGVDLFKRNILAVHLIIKNENSSTSYTIRADTITVAERTDAEAFNRPEGGSKNAGQAISIVALGSALVFPPSIVLTAPAAIQELSDAAVIETNFEEKKLRIRTLDPGQHAEGFVYFDWEKVKALQAVSICVELDDLPDKDLFFYCADVKPEGMKL